MVSQFIDFRFVYFIIMRVGKFNRDQFVYVVKIKGMYYYFQFEVDIFKVLWYGSCSDFLV